MQSNVLSMLTRLRQIALHPGLIPSNYLETLRAQATYDGMEDHAAGESVHKITPAERSRLQDLLRIAIEDNEECPVCFDILSKLMLCRYFCLLFDVYLR